MYDFSEDTVYFVTYAKLPEEMAAAHMHKLVGVGFFINSKTGIIEDVVVTLLSDKTKRFLSYLFVGHNLEKDGVDALIKKVEKRYHGYAQKAIIVGIKGTYERYMRWKEKQI